FALGRGVMCAHRNSRRLEDGVLPILHGTMVDEDVRYEITTFVVPEKTALSAGAVHVTDYLVAYSHGIGCTFTEAQKKRLDQLAPRELNLNEEPVLYLRAEAINTGSVPRYAWIKSA